MLPHSHCSRTLPGSVVECVLTASSAALLNMIWSLSESSLLDLASMVVDCEIFSKMFLLLLLYFFLTPKP